MKVKVVQDYPNKWPHPGCFPTFEAGTLVAMESEETEHFIGWHSCEIEGHKAYVPRVFVCDGKLTRDYNPTELIQKAGDILEVQEIAHAWLLATNEEGQVGWITPEVVVGLRGEV